MARSMARQAFMDDEGTALAQKNPGDFDDSWPEEPTAVDAALTMEELIIDELRPQSALPAPANDPRKETLRR
jgi:hypothetical protein